MNVCPRCHHPNPAHHELCERCGAALPSDAPTHEIDVGPLRFCLPTEWKPAPEPSSDGVEWCAPDGLARCRVLTVPELTPTEVEGWLEARGFEVEELVDTDWFEGGWPRRVVAWGYASATEHGDVGPAFACWIGGAVPLLLELTVDAVAADAHERVIDALALRYEGTPLYDPGRDDL